MLTRFTYASFADGPGGGNPAEVVTSDKPIDGAEMQRIATDIALPTTGFVVLDETTAAGTASVRLFTPAQEIDACGYVCLAVAVALHDLGVWFNDRRYQVNVRGGPVPIALEDGDDGRPLVAITQRLLHRENADAFRAEAERALGVRVDPHATLHRASTGLRHLLVPLTSTDALARIRLSHESLVALGRRAEVDTIGVYWRDDSELYLRDLCAPIGDTEEAASGTTAASLAACLADGRAAGFTVRQGREMGRPSKLHVSTHADGDIIVRGTATLAA
jgi:PhzF family phenazine biosynthesis protein